MVRLIAAQDDLHSFAVAVSRQVKDRGSLRDLSPGTKKAAQNCTPRPSARHIHQQYDHRQNESCEYAQRRNFDLIFPYPTSPEKPTSCRRSSPLPSATKRCTSHAFVNIPAFYSLLLFSLFLYWRNESLSKVLCWRCKDKFVVACMSVHRRECRFWAWQTSSQLSLSLSRNLIDCRPFSR